jgi:hypothetical protein
VALFAVLASVLCAGANAEPAGTRSFDLAISGGRLASGARTLRVQQGDQVSLRWTSDRPITLHLHGYDLELEIEPGVAAAMQFEARATGRFPVEIHQPGGRHATLLYLEVHPR